MAYYEFETSSGEIKIIEYKMSEAPPVGSKVKVSGEVLTRIFSSDFLFSNSSKVDPFSKDEFLKKTRESNLTYGDVVELSAEMSQERKNKEGKDVIKDGYSEKRDSEILGAVSSLEASTKVKKFSKKYSS